MDKGKVSVLIPARNERYLQPTIDSLLSQARGDIEILVVLDGYWPDPPLKDDERVILLHRGKAEGMRPAINSAAKMANGEFLLKCDAHCIFAEGYDEALKADCDRDWVVVPTRHSINIERWTPSMRHYNYHVLTFPYLPSMYGEGLHAITFPQDINRIVNAEYADRLVDDLMSFQGSCWFQYAENFRRLGELDHENYYFYQEAQEVGLRQWMTGGRCVVNKKTWYAHMHKGRDHKGADGRVGRGFFLSLDKKRKSERYATDFWLNDRWPGATRTFVSLVEQFWPQIEYMKDPRYAWPPDWRDFAKHKTWFENRSPDEIPAHL